MYYIEVGLGRRYRFMAVFFSVCGMIGCLAMFQANQLAEILTASYRIPSPVTGVGTLLLAAVVIIGGVKRIAYVSSLMVPVMCGIYLVAAVYIAAVHSDRLGSIFYQIFHDAFTGTAAAGGAAGIGFMTVMQTGIKRAAFSNEAGIGTAPMAHGAAKTREPVREGLVAMMGPFVDTIIICSLTAFIILAATEWKDASGIQGVALLAHAFENVFGAVGTFLLVAIVAFFGLSTMFGYSYYGKKCFSYLFGAHRSSVYDYFYLAMLYVGAVWSARMVVNMLDTAFALMAVPNMIAALLLAPRVMKATRDYLARYR